jgi:hypothetical protein
MKSYKRLVMVALLTLMAMSLFVARAEESGKTEKSAKTKQSIALPDKVAAAFAKSYPKAKVLNVSKETKDSVTYFEVEARTVMCGAISSIPLMETPLKLRSQYFRMLYRILSPWP